MDNFINLLINAIIKNDKYKYDATKNVLNHNIMKNVYQHLQNSNAMFKAVEGNNQYALKWFQSMKINPYVKDENGMTILMHAIQNYHFDNYLKPFTSDKKCLNQVDNEGRNALFYALNNSSGLWKLIESGIDVNHKDNNGDTILIYCCKMNKLSHFKYLLKQKVDVNAKNNEGRTAAMYIAMNGNYSDVSVGGGTEALYSSITDRTYSTVQNLKNSKYNFNFINNQGESFLSMLIKHMYETTTAKKFDGFVRTIISLVLTECDFNIPIDDDENNTLMVQLLAKDYESFNFLIKHRKDLDLKKQNKNGECVTSLIMKNKDDKIPRSIINHPTFDLDYTDPTNGNNILMFSVITKPYLIPEILNKKPEFLHEINSKGENALIIACKANNYESVISLLNYPVSININHQDELSNTALHYAVECRNPIIVQELINKKANDQLKNIEGKSPYDLANDLGDKNILEALKGTLNAEMIKNIRNNDQSEALKGIEEYLYPCTNILEYSGINLSEDIIETEKYIYKTMEKALSPVGKTNRFLSIAIPALFGFS
ncbi:ankyrin [Anaeromyces robustus]|uniref:Ankyrin n=1 Tax=Anaeromyces robustus TaxID=1754192 RepID=A0A1Y1X8X6_9FUNG|nr:ankyrin [Anaeromyces robustus]|eukprot:ORX82169.1 ankyrin [Anaeromyces robustus]